MINHVKRYWVAYGFALCMLGGLALLVIWPISVQLSCPPEQPTAWHIEGYETAAKNKRDPKKSVYSATQKKDTDKQDYATQNDRNRLVGFLCRDVKPSDIATVYFTFCLVVIGVFAIVVVDKTTKRAERAYLVAGPFFGIPNQGREGTWEMSNRAEKSMFHGPWRMIVTNFGKTAAYSTKIEWGLCPFKEFPLDLKIRELLDSQSSDRVEWRKKWMRPTDVSENIFGETNRPYHLRFVEIADRDDFVGWVHFGRVTYRDVFKEQHWTTFAYYMLDEYSTAIGRHISEEHD